MLGDRVEGQILAVAGAVAADQWEEDEGAEEVDCCGDEGGDEDGLRALLIEAAERESGEWICTLRTSRKPILVDAYEGPFERAVEMGEL